MFFLRHLDEQKVMTSLVTSLDGFGWFQRDHPQMTEVFSKGILLGE